MAVEPERMENGQRSPHKIDVKTLSVATPAKPRGEKKLFFVQILGGEKLLKFGEKCR